MTDLGDLLELTYGAGESFRTIRATIRTWRDEELYAEAFARFAAASGGRHATLYAFGGDEEPADTTERVERLWWEPPARVRSEVDGESTWVSDGAQSWHYTPSFGTITSSADESELGPGEAALLLDPAPILGGLDFEIGGRETFIGRDAIRVRARPRRGQVDWHDFGGLAPGADEYALVIDAERGVLLRAAAVFEGKEFVRSELVEVAFDELFPPETFAFDPPPGEPVRTQEELAEHRLEHLSLEEAARRVPFPLWIPARVPADWTMDVRYVPAIEAWSHPERVMIAYHSEADEPSFVYLQEAAASEEPPPSPRWRRLEREGQQLHVLEDERGRAPAQVRLEREGTAITISGQNVEADELIELASALVRAPSERPPLRA
jgi:outer membrane lipoprotein-sorting protein